MKPTKRNRLAESANRQAKRQRRAEVDQLLKATKIDEQMKAFGQWQDWMSHRRGLSQ
jgi:hypothetical protein